MEAQAADQPAGFSSKSVLAAVEKWLLSKGKVSADGSRITLADGEVATIERYQGAGSEADLNELTLTQPKGDGWFRTSIAVASSPAAVTVHIALSAASSTLTPLVLDVRCPRIVADLLKLGARWKVGNSPVSPSAAIVADPKGVESLIAQIWRADRSVPIITVSENRGVLLHPDIVDALARDLAGLASVVHLKHDSSYTLSEKKGKQWSCYMGAVRIYWPSLTPQSKPFDHPLWTLQRLLGASSDAATASERLRSQLRRRILSQSAFAIAEPAVITKTRREARSHALELATMSMRSAAGDLYRVEAEKYSKEVERLTLELADRDTQIEDLKQKVANLQIALQWKESSPDAIEPVSDTPPETVEDAVLIASGRFGDTLVFGADVNEGLRGVDKDSGPPEKLLLYLSKLAELTALRRSGSLGMTALKWLATNGVNASGESETSNSSKAARQKRTWDDGSGKATRYFEDHLKPAEGVAPSKCVRIYFVYDEATKKTIIGWVGRHPK